MNWSRLSLLLLLLVLSSHSCKEENEAKQSIQSEQELKDKLIEFNKNKLKAEDEIIDDLISESYPDVLTTETGLRYKIYKQGSGLKAENKAIASVHYRINLIGGEEIYSTAKSGPEKIMIGYQDVPSGLHEGLLLMTSGDSAIFIMPSHRAYGFTGEEGTVPQNAILIYHVELIDIE